MGRNCQFIEISRIRIDIFLCSFLIRFWVNNQQEHLPVKLVLPIKYDFDMLVRLQGFSRSTQSISCLTRTPINQYPTHGNRLLLMPRLHQSNFILTPRRFDVNDPKNPNIKILNHFPKFWLQTSVRLAFSCPRSIPSCFWLPNIQIEIDSSTLQFFSGYEKTITSWIHDLWFWLINFDFRSSYKQQNESNSISTPSGWIRYLIYPTSKIDSNSKTFDNQTHRIINLVFKQIEVSTIKNFPIENQYFKVPSFD